MSQYNNNEFTSIFDDNDVFDDDNDVSDNDNDSDDDIPLYISWISNESITVSSTVIPKDVPVSLKVIS
ncbi:8591_t:CDS:2 [Entrophospora sp. SA101]|nr:8591_t:CDS:2 [Entrophospora sp. SA101]